MEIIEPRLLQEIIPFDVIQMIATYLGDVDYWRFRRVCKTTTRLLSRRTENEIKLRSCACSLIENSSLPFSGKKIMRFNECDVVYTKLKGINYTSHTFEFTMLERRARIIIYDNGYYNDYYCYFHGTFGGIYVNYGDAEKNIRITIFSNGNYVRVSGVPIRELLNTRAFPSFKEYNMYLWNSVKDTEFGQRNMSLFQEILN